MWYDCIGQNVLLGLHQGCYCQTTHVMVPPYIPCVVLRLPTTHATHNACIIAVDASVSCHAVPVLSPCKLVQIKNNHVNAMPHSLRCEYLETSNS
jgi:hypothetical protein